MTGDQKAAVTAPTEEIGTLRSTVRTSQTASLSSAVGSGGADRQRAHPRLGVGVAVDQTADDVVVEVAAELGPALEQSPLQVDVVLVLREQGVDLVERAVRARPRSATCRRSGVCASSRQASATRAVSSSRSADGDQSAAAARVRCR